MACNSIQYWLTMSISVTVKVWTGYNFFTIDVLQTDIPLHCTTGFSYKSTGTFSELLLVLLCQNPKTCLLSSRFAGLKSVITLIARHFVVLVQNSHSHSTQFNTKITWSLFNFVDLLRHINPMNTVHLKFLNHSFLIFIMPLSFIILARPLTLSTPAIPNCRCSKASAPYWSNPPFLIFDIRALWRSVLSARVSECQKLKMVG